jgi:hypothetical protein
VKRIAALAAFALACAHGHAAVTTTVIDLPTQVPTRILDMRPPYAVANIVAVSGGNGQFGITGPQLPSVSVCVPIGRNAIALSDHGLAVVLVDNQFSDVGAVIAYLWNRDHLPIWIHGGSSGTGIVVSNSAGTPANIPLGALIWGPGTTDLAQAATITRPVQIIYHVDDPLSNANAPALYAALTSASARELVPFGGGTNNGCDGAYHLLTGLDAEWLAATLAFVAKYMPAIPPSGPAAVEYFNAGFGHYFMTADGDEISGLDGGAYGGAFVRTGRQFNVFDAPGTGTVPVCRFFTTPGHFGTRSSHFYTADPVECEGVKHYPDWQYEKIAFHIGVPAGGVCAAGTVPVYRMFNNGHTGAPNHRFTTDLALYQQFTATPDWAAEGIVFCAPP